MGKNKYEMDMCSGPIFMKMVRFGLPIMISSLLQLLYNAADIIVVGRYVGGNALAAVGATGSIIHLIVCLFLGLSVGVSVTVAQHFGAKREREVSETVHTAVTLGIIGGIVLGIVGFSCTKTVLTWMGTPSDIFDLSVKYMRLYFVGIPAMIVYNFSAAVLQAIGDTKRPMYFLTFAGIINVILNLCFVLILKMSVEGVAIATTVSQYISMLLVLITLSKSDACYRLEWSKLALKKDKVISILKIGLPAGLQATMFAISNVMIQSSINSFGSVTIAGNTASGNIGNFIYNAMYSVYHCALTFSGQNVGAKKPERLPKILATALCLVSIIGLVMGCLANIFGRELLGIYNTDPAVIEQGMIRNRWVLLPYVLCGLMDVFVGMLRGIGYSVTPMLISLIGACGLRLVWIFTVFARFRTTAVLYASYLVTWTITLTAQSVCYFIVKPKVVKRLISERKENPQSDLY